MQRTDAVADAVGRAGHEFGDAPQRGVGMDDARLAEQFRQGRIVGMQGELDARALGHGQDFVEEAFEIFPHLRRGRGVRRTTIGIGDVVPDIREVEFGDARSAAFDHFATGALPVFIGHPIIAKHVQAVVGHQADERFEIGELRFPTGEAMDEFQMRHFSLEMGEAHAEAFHHGARVAERGGIEAGKSQDDFADANLGGKLEVPFVERINDHGKFHGQWSREGEPRLPEKQKQRRHGVTAMQFMVYVSGSSG